MSDLAAEEVRHCKQKQDTLYGSHLQAREVRQDVQPTSNWLPLQANDHRGLHKHCQTGLNWLRNVKPI